MRSFAGFFLAAASLAQPVPVIFDTDMGNDVDDAIALAMLHALESRGESKLLAVTITKDNLRAAQFVDLVNHFYGRPSIPIGLVTNGKTRESNPMISVPVSKLVYPRRIETRADVADAQDVLWSTLNAAADQSVTVIQVGFSTNLVRLLDREGGRELVAKKVKLLSIMAGWFPNGKPEYNVRIDIPSAKKIFTEWPTPIVASGFEIGLALPYPASSVERDYAYTRHHPIADSYRAYLKMPYDRPTWDPTSVLYGVRPNAGDFGLSAPGTIVVADDGRTTLNPSPEGKHRYLTLDPANKDRIVRTMIELASRPPDSR
ncbi:MAG: nucleoside hydrolase [Bryobacteraceae bacterium]|nr:nucleoside hydrolase [Bryobacteraceae bacterium]